MKAQRNPDKRNPEQYNRCDVGYKSLFAIDLNYSIRKISRLPREKTLFRVV